MKARSYLKGLWAELYVMAFLKLKFYTILQWRYKAKQGEIGGSQVSAFPANHRPSRDIFGF